MEFFNNKIFAGMALCCSLTLPFQSAAHESTFDTEQCEINLNYDLSVSPQHVRIINKDETMIDIYNDKVLFIKGDQIDLSNDQQIMVSNYSKSIRAAVPEVVDIAVEAIGVAYEALDLSLGKFTDISHTQDKFEAMQQKIVEKYSDTNGHYAFKDGELSFSMEDDQEIDRMVEELLEDAMPALVGGLLANIGQAMVSGDSDFNDLESLGENIEKEIEAKAHVIEKKAHRFCKSIEQLDVIEDQLVQIDDRFEYFDLIDVQTKAD